MNYVCNSTVCLSGTSVTSSFSLNPRDFEVVGLAQLVVLVASDLRSRVAMR
jgi:hypothetical protein